MTVTIKHIPAVIHPLALAFKQTQFMHPKLSAVLDQLRDIDQPSHRERIYILTGPTGAAGAPPSITTSGI